MKNIIVITLCSGIYLFLSLFAASPCHAVENQAATEETAHAKAASAVIARVGSGQVTLGQTMNKIKELTIKNYANSQITPTIAAKIKKEAIDILINEEVAYQHAKNIGIQVTPGEIQAHIETFKKSLGNDDKFREYLVTNNMTIEEFKVLAERFLAVKKAMTKEVDENIREVTKEDMVQAYNEAKEQYFVQKENVVVTDIIFLLAPEEKETLEKITAIRNQLTQELSGDTSKLASDPSFIVRENLTLSKSVDLGLYEAAKKLQAKEISAPVKSNGTYHLIKLLSYIPQIEKSFDQVQPYLKKELKKKFREERINEWMQNLRKNEAIEIIETKRE